MAAPGGTGATDALMLGLWLGLVVINMVGMALALASLPSKASIAYIAAVVRLWGHVG